MSVAFTTACGVFFRWRRFGTLSAHPPMQNGSMPSSCSPTFADTNDTKAVAELIDAFVTRTATGVSGNGGEIDKIIGDGVLAVFRQPDAVAHAFDAALACIRACRDLERRPGVGLYRGEVVATAVGTSERADFTVLGRTVNLASRLCSLAGEAEIVAPAGFAHPLRENVEEVSRETVTPRNHLLAEEVVRYRLRD